jgi:NAD-dependent dihydropyrimidine dehydrogenase PreA subunit
MQRREPPALQADRRIGVSKVELGFDEALAQDQGARCLICSINPIFDSDLCVLCNGCVDVCPQDCLKLIPVSDLEGDERFATLIDYQIKEGSEASAMLLDPSRCIRCGLCAARCPTEAVRMESFQFTEELIFENLVVSQ